MTGTRRLAAAIALFCAVAVTGCGLGAGGSIGSVEETISTDFGTKTLLQKKIDDVHESDTVLRVLDRTADITTRYGGGFVQSINGIEGGTPGGRVHDWFYFVNGVEASIGSADFSLHDGDRIWWDYRDWSAAMRAPAVVGSFPEPFVHGYQGEFHPVDLACLGGGRAACGTVAKQLGRAGADLSGTHDNLSAMEVIVGPWSDIGGDKLISEIASGPSSSGIYATFSRGRKGYELTTLDPGGSAVRRLGPGTGLIAAMRQGDDNPTWVITGTDRAGVQAAANALDAADLENRYAVAVHGGHVIALPDQ